MERTTEIKNRIDYPLAIENLDGLIEALDSHDNRKVGKAAMKLIDNGDWRPGPVNAVKKAIKGLNKSTETATENSKTAREEAREDRMLRVRDSEGKAKAR